MLINKISFESSKNFIELQSWCAHEREKLNYSTCTWWLSLEENLAASFRTLWKWNKINSTNVECLSKNS